ncbi:hypothetical protein ACFSTC_41050 [Nonomuraea ferruginea]
MDPRLDDDLVQLPDLLKETQEHAVRLLEGLAERPVAPPPGRREPVALPERGEGARGALEAFARRWEPGFSASAGPPATWGSSPAAAPPPRSRATG